MFPSCSILVIVVAKDDKLDPTSNICNVQPFSHSKRCLLSDCFISSLKIH
jgi:hypothetical protein